MTIQLNFESFEVEPVDDCSTDFVIIVDGLITSKTVMPTPSPHALTQSQDTRVWQRLCGIILPQPLTSSRNQLGVMFHSDYTLNYKGFKVTYQAMNASFCQNGHDYGGTRGVFSDGSGSNGKYWNNWNCTYRITVPPGNIISLLLLKLDVEPSRFCQFDYFDVWNVGANDREKILRLCGSKVPSAIVSLTNKLEINFVTDGSRQYGGFVASYRACERCPDGMYSELPCFDVFHGFCIKCSTCAADEYIAQNCSAISDTKCAKLGTTLSVAPCSAFQYQCRDGSCLSSMSVCDGKVDCLAGDDERYCSCNSTEFTCTNKKCVPYYYRCDGYNDCLDDSDEVHCGCGQDMFECQNKVCISSNWRCDGEKDCNNGIDEQGCQGASHGGDPCFVGGWPKSIINPSFRVTTVEKVRRCLESIPLKPAQQQVTIELIRQSLLQSYSYGDLVRNSSNTDSHLSPGLNYSSYDIAVDYNKELSRIAATTFHSAYQFHENLTALFTKFRDAHTFYYTPFSILSSAFPFVFGSVLLDGVQRVTIDRVVNATFPDYHQVHSGHPYINLDKFNSEYLPKYQDTPGLQNLVSTINGVDALNCLKMAAEEVPNYKDESVRFNVLLGYWLKSMANFPLPKRNSMDLVFDDNTKVSIQYTMYVSCDTETNLRPLFTVQEDLKKLMKLTKLNAELEQFLYTSPSSALFRQRKRKKRQIGTQPKVLTSLPSTHYYKNKVVAFYDSDAIIFKLTTFDLSEVLTNPLPIIRILNTMFQTAKQKKTDHLLIDLIGNGGGSVFVSYIFMLIFVPEWSSDLLALSEDYDIRISPLLTQLVKNIENTHRTFPKKIAKNEALSYIHRLENFTDGFNTIFTTGSLNSLLLSEIKTNVSQAGLSDEERATLVHQFVNTSLLEPVESNLLATMIYPVSKQTNASLTLSEIVKQTVVHNRGGVLGNYSQKFKAGIQSPIEEYYKFYLEGLFSEKVFKRITILTDGTCGSACSMFLTKMLLEKKAVVVSYGGIHGKPMDVSSFEGGNVLDWSDYWPSALHAVAASNFYSTTFNETAKTFGYSTPLPLPTAAMTRFAFTEIYSPALGPNSLPREWYLLPAHVHLPIWATGVGKWPTEQQHTLLNLYRSALAADKQYRMGHVYQNTQQPCYYTSKCRPHFHGLWSRGSVIFLNVSLWKDTFLLYNSSSCEDSHLLLNTTRYATWTDMGPNLNKPTRLRASHVRRIVVKAAQYDVVIDNPHWLEVFKKSCPCSSTFVWRMGVRHVITNTSCLSQQCSIRYITFEPVYGNYILQDPSFRVYKSHLDMSADAGALSAINGDETFILTTVFQRCFPATEQPTMPPVFGFSGSETVSPLVDLFQSLLVSLLIFKALPAIY